MHAIGFTVVDSELPEQLTILVVPQIYDVRMTANRNEVMVD